MYMHVSNALPPPPQYQKSRKRQQRLEKLQQKEAEREAQRRTATYTLSVQDLLNSIGEEDKENFRTGNNGAVVRGGEEGRGGGGEGRGDVCYGLLLHSN